MFSNGGYFDRAPDQGLGGGGGEGATIVEYVKIVFSNIGYFDRAPDWVGGGGVHVLMTIQK